MKFRVPNKENHYALWDWLAKNPRRQRQEWPGFVTLERLGIFRAWCFACLEFKGCSTCPVAIDGFCKRFLTWDKNRSRENAIAIRDSWK
ncbi:MAG: hypothetical protein WC455_28235 [Dehalococcoidia bacterium]|jgi:hypothetical protein